MAVMERADDDEFECYLLQLVQALRYERSDKSHLAFFLVQRGRLLAMFPNHSFVRLAQCDQSTCLKYNKQ